MPATTVLYTKISGLKAWSVGRDPNDVFTLLETLFGSFDKIAARRSGIYKVEATDDTYIAVCGAPDEVAAKNHASVVARFATDCRSRSVEIFHNLETTLGTGTKDLSLRFGLHSGPVVGGVLRGQRNRFQLFGDTVLMASEMAR